jgi:DNA-binding HxlR family transcriptional regulator
MGKLESIRNTSSATVLRRRSIRLSDCPVRTALNVVGGKWKPLILYFLKDGTQRYSDLRGRISEPSEKVLVQQLRELERDGVLERVIYPEVPPRVEYCFSEYGWTLVPMLREMAEWGENHRKRELPKTEGR